MALPCRLGKRRPERLEAAAMPRPPLEALLSTGELPPGPVPPGLLPVAGRALIERQARQVARAGAARILVLAPALPEAVERRLTAIPGVALVEAADGLADQLKTAPADSSLLVIEPGALIDDRLLEAVRDAPGPAALAVARVGVAEGAERLDREAFFAGVLKLAPAAAGGVLAEHPGWEPVSTLMRAAAPAATQVIVEQLPTYAERNRRKVPILWAYPATSGTGPAEKAIIDAAQKGCLDWPARFLHPPVENLLVRWLWPTPITPNMVTLATGVLGLAAMVFLALGQFWPGLALILAIGPLDGVDGKLARTRIEFSKYGDLEHVLDKILEYSWFLAMGWWFWSTGHGLAAWLVAGGICLFAILEAIQGEYFRRFAGRQLDDWGPFERRFRLVAGRRNTFFWALIPFGLAGAWWLGFVVLLAYAGLTFVIAEWRFLKALAEYARAHSPNVRENFDRTTYGFLPGAGPGSS